MQEEQVFEDNEMNDEELVKALQKLSELTEFEAGKSTYESAKMENNRDEYLQVISSRKGPSPNRIPCKSVVFTKGMGPDGKMHTLQITNPAKRVLQQERRRRKKNRSK